MPQPTKLFHADHALLGCERCHRSLLLQQNIAKHCVARFAVRPPVATTPFPCHRLGPPSSFQLATLRPSSIMQAVSSAQRPAPAVAHSRRLQPATAFCSSPAVGSQRLAVVLPRRQLARQPVSSWQRQQAARPVVAAAAPRDFDKDRFEAANKDYAKLTQQIEVRLGQGLWGGAAEALQARLRESKRPCLPHSDRVSLAEQRLCRPHATLCRTPRQRWWRVCRAPACSWWG